MDMIHNIAALVAATLAVLAVILIAVAIKRYPGAEPTQQYSVIDATQPIEIRSNRA